MGLIVLDAGVLIGFLDANDAHHGRSHIELSGALSTNEQLLLPASALTETLVGPSRRGPEAVDIVRKLIARVPIVVVPLDEAIAADAASIRATHRSLRLPDALVVATTRILQADLLVTTGRRWPSSRDLKLKAEIRVL